MPKSQFDIATLQVGAESAIAFEVNGEKWLQFLAAMQVIGRPPESLLAEAIDLCMDTAIALAAHRHHDSQP